MTKQEIIDLIVRKGDGEINADGNGLFTIPSTEIFNIADAIIARQDERLKEFVEYVKQSWQEEINTYEKLQKEEDCPYMAREAIKSKLIGMRKMLGLLECDLEKFLEVDE